MIDIVIRPAVPGDQEILWDFLAMAAYEQDAAAAKSVPMVAAWLDGWQRPHDFGFIAERDGHAIGAVWARQFWSREESWFYLDERTPEISIGVKEHARGQGVGEILLRALIAEATMRGLRLCLNVRNTNPARHLYERMGFQAVPGLTVRNRIGGLSTGMVWSAPA
jgi:ribosomal protein S18 acetylase RimI-like enzyme